MLVGDAVHTGDKERRACKPLLVAMSFVLAGCGDHKPPSEAKSDWTPPPALQEAIDRHRVKAAAEDQAADAAKASDSHWSGSAERAQKSDYLEAGQDLTNPERAALASFCRQVAKAAVSNDHIRVATGGPTPSFTCKLASGGTIKVRIDGQGDPHRAH
jgi:hypothetical protein